MKKILALVLAFAMMFSTITVAFAEGEVSAEAKALATVGMLVGDGNGVTVEYTAKEMDRLTAAAALLKLKGLYAEAAAYVGDANFADADTVKWAEGKNIMAYLKANPGLGFAGNENGEFKPFDKINEQSYVKVLLETLGYKQSTAEVVGDFAWADVLTFAASVGLAPVNATPFTVDALAKLTVAALKAEMKDGKVLINVLVDGGKVDKEKAIAAELYVDAPVVTAALDSAKAIGNSVVEVTFDAAVNEGAEDVAMYAIEGLEVKAAVVAGEDVVRLTTAAMTAGKLYTLTVGDVKVKFTGIEKVSGKPEIAGVTSTDVEEVVIEFSKDLDFASATDAANYTIAGVEVVEAELDEDTVTLTTSGLANKKQYTVKFTNLKSIDGVVNKSGSKSFYTRFDTLAPTVSKVEAKTNVQVNVTFNEEVSEATAEDLANYVIKTGDTELAIESATLVEDDDDEYTIVELTTEAQKPNARYSITIENISDATKAENTMAKTVTKTFYGKREDTKAPTYTVKPYAISRNQIIVEFADESDIDEASVLDVNNYTLTKGSDELTIDAVEEYDFDDGIYQVMLTVEDLNVGTYALEVVDIADEFGNAMEDSKKLYFSVTRDSYASATVVGYEVTATNKIEVEFSKPLVEATAEDLANYEFDNDLGAPVKASYADRVVTLTVTGFDLGEEYELTIAGVEDLAGNVLDLSFEFVAELGDEDEDAPELVDIYAVNKYVVAVSFDEAVEYDETTVLNLSNGVTLEAKALTEDDTVIEFSADGEVLTTANEYAVLDGSLLGITDEAGNEYVPADLDEYVVYGNDEDPEDLEVLSVVQIDGKSFEVTMSRNVFVIEGEYLDGLNWTLDVDDDVVTFVKKSGQIEDKDPYYYAVDLSELLADAHGVVATNLDSDTETRLYVEFEDDDAPYIVNVTATDRFTVEIEYSEVMGTAGSYAVKNADDSVSKALISPVDVEIDDELVILTFSTPFEGRYDYILVIGADEALDLVGKEAEEQEDDEFYFSGTDLAPVELEVAK